MSKGKAKAASLPVSSSLKEQQEQPSSFIEYLNSEEVQAQLRHNSTTLITTPGLISRYFNELPNFQVESVITPLLDIKPVQLKESNVSFKAWKKLVLAQALNDLVEENGRLRTEVFDALNIDGIMIQLVNRFGEEVVKKQLLGAYLYNLSAPIIENYGQAYPDVDLTSLILTLNKLKNSFDVIDKASVDSIRLTIKEVINAPGFPKGRLKNRIRDFYIHAAHPEYVEALQALKSSTGQIERKNSADGFIPLVSRLIWAAEDIITERGTNAPFASLTAAFKKATALIHAPTPANIEACRKQAIKMDRRSWGKIICSSLLILAGAALLATSAALLLATFGTAAPASLLTASVGLSALGKGLAVMGAGSLGFGGFRLFRALRKNPIRKELEHLSHYAEKSYKLQMR